MLLRRCCAKFLYSEAGLVVVPFCYELVSGECDCGRFVFECYLFVSEDRLL